MRGLLSLLLITLAAAAGLDASTPSTPSTPAPPPGAQMVTASITGPSGIGHATSCDWTGSASGGTAPYSYRWVPSYTGSNSYFVGGAGPVDVFHGIGYYFGSGSWTTVWLFLEVTDANGQIATTTKYITLYNSAYGCV